MISASKNSATGPYIVGITGGIGAGKTTVTRMFADLGASVIDADQISRELMQPGSACLAEVEAYFGKQIFNNNELDRAHLREIIFTDPTAKAWLEQLLHPRIHTEILRQIAASERQWLLLSVPLLLESEAYDFVDTVIIVDAPDTLQVARTMERDNVVAAEVANIMAAQMSREDRLMRADIIIYNDADLAHLQRQVASLFQKFEEVARDRNQTG